MKELGLIVDALVYRQWTTGQQNDWWAWAARNGIPGRKQLIEVTFLLPNTVRYFAALLNADGNKYIHDKKMASETVTCPMKEPAPDYVLLTARKET